LQERNRRKNSNPAKHFIPNGKQEQYINMVGSGDKFVSMFCAANGVGKTCGSIVILTNIIFGPQNEWFEEEAFDWKDKKGVTHTREAIKLPMFQEWPYIKYARIISDPNTIKSKIIPEMEKWFPVNEVKNFPEAHYEMGKEGKNYICKIKTDTGWTIDIMSTEQSPKEFESTDVGLLLIDEPIPKDRFMGSLARGRLGMAVMWGFTPLTYSAWIKEWMDEHAKDGYADYVEAAMEDNCEIVGHGVRGILKHENIQKIHDGYPEDERQARVFGKFGHLIGRIHKAFSRKIHVIEPFPLDEREWTTYFAVDTHPNTADHVLYLSVDANRRKVLTGEVLSQGGCKKLYERCKTFEAAMHYRMDDRLIEPAAYNKDQHSSDHSVGEQLHNLGWKHLIRGSKDLTSGIKRTNDAFDFQMNGEKMIIPPELFVFSSCVVAIKQIEQYVWQEFKGPTKDDKKASSRPRDKDDHQPENLHRLLLHEPKFVPMPAEEHEQYGSYQKEIDSLNPY